MAIQGITPKGRHEVKKIEQEKDVMNVTRSEKNYKPSFLEKYYPKRDMGEGQKPSGLKITDEQEIKHKVPK